MLRFALWGTLWLGLGCAHARLAAAKEQNARSFTAALDQVLAEEDAAPLSCSPTPLGFESCGDDAPPLTLALCDGTSAVVDVPARRAFAKTGALVSATGPVTIDWQQRGSSGEATVVYARKRSGELLRVELVGQVTATIEEPAGDCLERLPPGPRLPVFLSTRPVRTVQRRYDVARLVGCR